MDQDMNCISDVKRNPPTSSREEDMIRHETWEFKFCEKQNHGPTGNAYILAMEFLLEHLPVFYRYMSIYNVINVMSLLTVKVEVPKTSRERPEKDPDNLDYPFYNPTGKKHTMKIGSGMVIGVAFPTKGQEYGSITIRTAKHVVFDSFEASETLTIFDDYKCLKATRVLQSCIHRDQSIIEIATKDLALIEMLRSCLQQKATMARDLKSSSLALDQAPHNLVVIVSHPHGGRKRVSIGHWHQVKNGRFGYDTATCEGSSGAPVWVLGIEGSIDGLFVTTHSRSIDGLNWSGGSRESRPQG